MDKGAILAQTDNSGLEIPCEARESFPLFVEYMAPYGAELLLKTLKRGLYKEPSTDLSSSARSWLHDRQPQHARKLDIEDRHIDWSKWPADKILRYQKLLKTLWNDTVANGMTIKLVWSGQFSITEATEFGSDIAPGIAYTSADGHLWLINTADGKVLRVQECTIAGDKSRTVSHVAKKYKMTEDESGDSRKLRAIFK